MVHDRTGVLSVLTQDLSIKKIISAAAKACLALFIALFVFGCLVKKPVLESELTRMAIEGAKNLLYQKSFDYNYEFQTIQVRARFRGQCLLGQGEIVEGTWRFAADTVKTELVGLYSIQYEKKDLGWEVHSRGEETSILVQIERALSLGRFEYVKTEGDKYLFYFKPNVLFLDPSMKKKITGEITISKKNHLATGIRASSTDSMIYWRMQLSRFNQPLTIDPPRWSTKKYRLTTDKDNLEKIRQRLDLCHIKHSLNLVADEAYLEVSEAIDKSLLADILACGEFGLYETASPEKNALISAALDRRIAGTEDIRKIEIKYDDSAHPYLAILFNKKILFSKPFALSLDRLVFAVKDRVDKPKNLDKIEVPIEMNYFEATIIKAKALSGSLKPIAISEAK